jgi:hypothetical protein
MIYLHRNCHVVVSNYNMRTVGTVVFFYDDDL